MVTRQPGEGASHSVIGEELTRDDFFAPAREGFAKMEREYRARKDELDTHEATMAEAKAAFQETAHEASALH